MREIEVENELGLKVFINGVPDLRQIPKDIAESIISALELRISEYYKSEQKRTDKAFTVKSLAQ